MLKKHPSSHRIACADDSLISIKYNKKNVQLLKESLLSIFQTIHSRCAKYKALINIEKSSLVCFQTRSHLDIQINTPFGIIQSCCSLKFLGVTFDSKLSFKQHLSNVLQSCITLKHSLISGNELDNALAKNAAKAETPFLITTPIFNKIDAKRIAKN
jgi:hypothetical protein